MLSQDQFELIINDTTKSIQGDIIWQENSNHNPSRRFRVDIDSQMNYPIFLAGSYHPITNGLTYAIIHKIVGRIYALDMGQDHRNPDGNMVGEIHKHRWTVDYQIRYAYIPQDITADSRNPVEVWKQFCDEAKITHQGYMHDPPPYQIDLFRDV